MRPDSRRHIGAPGSRLIVCLTARGSFRMLASDQFMQREKMMLTGPLCRAARALVEISRAQLSALSGVAEADIENFERKIAVPDAFDLGRLQEALAELGAVFIPEGSRGAGVRLKFTASERRRLQTLEGEGGIVRSDDVP